MVAARNEGPNFPSDPSVDLDVEQYCPIGLVLAEREGVVRSHRHGGSVDEGGPDVDLLVALVGGRDLAAEGDLLVAVTGVDVELVVVNTDLVIRIAGVKGDLEGGCEEVRRGGDVEGVDGSVLEYKPGLAWLENGPDNEHSHQDDEVEDEDARTDSLEYLAPLVPVVAAIRRHDSSLVIIRAVTVLVAVGGERSERSEGGREGFK
ncbi:hypothetical protein F2P56_005877 [Juglans regia]|uniref:Uncharacterized protein n=1 Tax=Juglans regia TaxID=51240 RepID=A0A834D2R3_JUGRE|nr:hypothetical protein F2P56_005877 [Juglans regia]